MKTALYFDEQDAQMVLTSETDWEKLMLRMLKERLPDGLAFEGGFYDCQGGWIRHQSDVFRDPYYRSERDFNGNSLMIRLPRKEQASSTI